MNPYLYGASKIIGEVKFLPNDELKVALSAPNKDELFVAGYYDYIAQHVMLFKANGYSLVVPASTFTPRVDLAPDFNLLELTSCGEVLKLGLYEVTNEFILKAVDPNFEKKREANEIRIRERAKVSN